MAQQRLGSPADRNAKRKNRPRPAASSLSGGGTSGGATASDSTEKYATLIQSHWRRKKAERDVDMIRMIYQNARQRRASGQEDEWWLRPEEPPKRPLGVFQGLGKDVIASARLCSQVKRSVGCMRLAAAHAARVKRLKHRLRGVLAMQGLKAECAAKAEQRDSLWRALCADGGEEDMVLDDARIKECDAAAVKIQHAWSKHVLRGLLGCQRPGHAADETPGQGAPSEGSRKRQEQLQGRIIRLRRLSAHSKAADLAAARAEQAARAHVRRMSNAMRMSRMGGTMGSFAAPPASAAAASHGARSSFQETAPSLPPAPTFSTSRASSSTPRPAGPQDAPAAARRPGQPAPLPTSRGAGANSLHFMPLLDPSPTSRGQDAECGGGAPGCSTPMRLATPRPSGDPCPPGNPRRTANPVGAGGLPAATPCRSRSLRPMARPVQGAPSSTLALVGGSMVSGGLGQPALQPGPTPRQATLAPPPSLVSPRAPMIVPAPPGRPVDPTAKGANASVLRPYAVQRTPRRA